MCGIAGFFWRENAAGSDSLGAAVARLRHRGPDANGTFYEHAVGLGHTRLAIIDLASGQQPLRSADGRFVIVFNGEIYNFPELREECTRQGWEFRTQSDTEVIVALYARLGADCVTRLRGMFAFAIYDRHERRLFLARDRLGVKPLVYAETPRGFFFASEIAALLAVNGGWRPGWDWSGLADYFARQYIQTPRTAFAGVRKLPAGTWLTLEGGRILAGPERYWFPERIAVQPMREGEARERLRHLFFEAVRLRLLSEVPLGAFLSGGVDSSITVAAMAQLLGKPFQTYSIGFDDARLDEREPARRVAAHCGTDHQEHTLSMDRELPSLVSTLVRRFGEPFADSSMIPSWHVARLARRSLTVVLTGDGADEVWGGYKRHYQAALMDRLNRWKLAQPWIAARRLTTWLESLGGKRRSFPVNQLDRLLLGRTPASVLFARKLDADERAELLLHPELLAASQAHEFDPGIAPNPEWDGLTKFLFFDLQTFLGCDGLFKVDITTMMNSLEARGPFLDHKLVEFAFSLPPQLKRPRIKDGKSLLKSTFADLLPPGHFDRPKMGFTPPLAQWLRTLLRDWCADLLRSRVCGDYLNRPVLLRWFEEHQQGVDHSKRLWLAAVFCEWAMGTVGASLDSNSPPVAKS